MAAAAAPPPARTGASRGRRAGRIALIVIAVFVVLVLVVQFAAEPVARRYLNKKLAQMDGFTGEVGQVNLSLWQGRVEVREFVLRDSEHPDDAPLVRLARAEFQGARRALLRGRLGGWGVVEGAEFTVIKRERVEDPAEETEDKVEAAREQARRWQRALSDALPMQIVDFQLRGSARFIDQTYQPEVKLEVKDLYVHAQNLHNLENFEAPPLTVDITGTTSGRGKLEFFLEAEPMQRPLQFYTSFRLSNVALTELDPFMRAYAKVIVTEGRFTVYTEVKAEQGRYEGYIRPFFEELEFEPVRNEEKSLGRRIVETVVDAASSLLENNETEQIATQTPFSGTFDENDVDLWATVENLLRNAFLQAIRQGFDPQEPE